MNMSQPAKTAERVAALERGDRVAAQELMPQVYSELRDLAARFLRREDPGHTLQPTALVHEVFMKLVDQNQVSWRGQTHFFAICAQAMRRILVDHARSRKRKKRGGGLQRIALRDDAAVSKRRETDVLAVDEALEKLARLDPRQAKIVELRFFGGFNIQEVAEVLSLSRRTVENEWTMIRAWLRRELAEGDNS